MFWISSITGEILGLERPARMMVFGFPSARERAVCAPSPYWEGPVMRTGFCVSYLVVLYSFWGKRGLKRGLTCFACDGGGEGVHYFCSSCFGVE